MPFHRVAGFSIDSDLALPGLDAREPEPPSPDIRIRHGAVPSALEDAEASGTTWARAGERFLLRIPGVARFLLTEGRDIVFAREDDTPDDDMAIFLATGALGILLHQRGEIVLNASAVEVGGKAVLFAGVSGAGKSTLAAALAERGYPLVTDELSVVHLRGGPLIHPDGGKLKLWAQAVDRLGLSGRRGAPVRPRIEKYFVEPARAVGGPLAIGALYDLWEARPPFVPGVSRPNVVDAALALRRNAYRPRLIGEFAQRPAYFHAVAAVAKSSGIFTLALVPDFGRMDEAVEMLERHWAEIGLLP